MSCAPYSLQVFVKRQGFAFLKFRQSLLGQFFKLVLGLGE